MATVSLVHGQRCCGRQGHLRSAPPFVLIPVFNHRTAGSPQGVPHLGRLSDCLQPHATPRARAPPADALKLYVGNIPTAATVEEIRDTFKGFGRVRLHVSVACCCRLISLVVCAQSVNQS